MGELSALSVEDLAAGICLRAGRITAAEAELLPWVAEFDRREGWSGTGLLSCAHWLSWQVGLSLPAAREQVRVARRLPDLPELAAAYADGRVSYSKVRAITRVADPDDGIDWVMLARSTTAAQLEQLVRGVRRAHAAEQAEVDPEAAQWSLRTRVRYAEDGSFRMTICGPAELLPGIQAGIDAKREQLQRQRDVEQAQAEAARVEAREQAATGVTPLPAQPDVSAETSTEAAAPAAPVSPEPDDLDEQAPGWPVGTTKREVREATAQFAKTSEARLQQWATEHDLTLEPVIVRTAPALDAAPHVSAETPVRATSEPSRVTDAEALLNLTQDVLAEEQREHPGMSRRRRPQLTAHIDPLSGWGRLADGELLPPTSLRTVMRTLPGRSGTLRLRPLSAADLRRHDLGRDSRDVSAALRELLSAVDGERCRFPGCTRRRKLHGHHVRYWSDGGPTDLSNLVLVCARHHTLIHASGFQLVLHPDRRLEVTTADGTRLLHHPAPAWGDPAGLTRHDVSAETLPPDIIDARMDLGYAVGVLMAQAA